MKYINIFDYADKRYPVQIFIGGRGTGKTYSALKGSLNKEIVPKKFIYMRRTGGDLESIVDTDDKGEGSGNPFKKINSNENRNIGLKMYNKKVAGIYEREMGDDGTLKHVGAPIGYGTALTLIATIRGIDFSDCSDWIYDEFIPEKHVKKINGECDALFNAYETIARNREMEGEEPLRLWLLANSNNIYNPIFEGLGIINIAERMLKNKQEHYYDIERGLAIHILKASNEFIEAKKKTALYKLTKGTAFYDMALNNDFSYNDFSLVKFMSIKGFSPIACINDKGYIYKKKGENIIYVSYAPARVKNYRTKEEQDRIRFLRDFAWLEEYFIQRRLIFESYELKEMILSLII